MIELKREQLARKYKEIYNRIRNVVNDEEVFRKLTDQDFESFVRVTDWFPVPSFDMTPKDIKKSDMAHISLRVNKNKIDTDLFFNGKQPIERFLNILKSNSKSEKEQFVNLIKNLGEKYSILIQYATKVPLAPANWETVGEEIKCFGLGVGDVERVLETIKNTEEKRRLEQKQWGGKRTVTMSIRLAKTELNNPSDVELKEVFSNLAELTKIIHNIKSVRELHKIEKGIPKLISNLEEEIVRDETHLEKVRGLKKQKTLGFENVDIEELEKKLNDKKNKLSELKKGHITVSKQHD